LKDRRPVSGCVIEGTCAYREYSWVAKAGDFARESPGPPMPGERHPDRPSAVLV